MVHLPQLVVAGGDSAKLLEAVDEPLHAVARPVGRPVKVALAGLGGPAGDDRANLPAAQALARGRATLALVAGQPAGAEAGPAGTAPPHRARVQQGGQGALLVPLPTRQGEGHRPAVALGADVDRGAAPAPAVAARVVAPPLAPAAWGCARTTVPSTKCNSQSPWPAASASACRAARRRSQIPACCHRRYRLSTVFHGPHRSGRSRHGTPVVSRHRMPWRIRRWSWCGRPVAGFAGGSRGASRSHCASVSSCRFIPPSYPSFADRP